MKSIFSPIICLNPSILSKVELVANATDIENFYTVLPYNELVAFCKV
jgi:hypothetical protein